MSISRRPHWNGLCARTHDPALRDQKESFDLDLLLAPLTRFVAGGLCVTRGDADTTTHLVDIA